MTRFHIHDDAIGEVAIGDYRFAVGAIQFIE
jgi:hypothetical protein